VTVLKSHEVDTVKEELQGKGYPADMRKAARLDIPSTSIGLYLTSL
jgi:hypothetical protein